MNDKAIPNSYYLNDDVLALSKDLLGKVLMTHIDGMLTGGIITETEAYRAPEDRASHAYGNKKTKRNAVMFERGGVAYVYKCYGIHDLFNIVCNEHDIPHAILIRAISPIIGIEHILKRRNKEKIDKTLCSGPGSLTQALGITVKHNGISLNGSCIWLENHGYKIPASEIIETTRIGIAYAKEDALLPWRFLTKRYAR